LVESSVEYRGPEQVEGFGTMTNGGHPEGGGGKSVSEETKALDKGTKDKQERGQTTSGGGEARTAKDRS
jgi:hypothetical protein